MMGNSSQSILLLWYGILEELDIVNNLLNYILLLPMNLLHNHAEMKWIINEIFLDDINEDLLLDNIFTIFNYKDAVV